MKFNPLRDRVLIKRIEEREQTKSGIVVPDTAKEKPMQGKVIAVGTGRVDEHGQRHALEVKVGDRVIFGKYAGTEVNVDEVEHVILKEDELLGIVQ